jgi:hypothetical protein
MSADQNSPPNEEPIPLELEMDDDSEANEPVPVPPPKPKPAQSEGESSGPVPVPPPTPKAKEQEDLDEPIKLVDGEEGGEEQRSTAKRVGGAAARGLAHKTEFKRPLNNDGKGATRCRLFNSKISEGPLLHMETVINEWLDSDEIEVKHVNTTIGVMEGKRADPNLLVMVWY